MWCGLTFELSRPRRQVGLAVRPMMNQGGCAAKPACRSGSALERGVRPHQRGRPVTPSTWPLTASPVFAAAFLMKLRYSTT